MAVLPVVFPDAEETMINYLRPFLPTAPKPWTIHRATPNPRPPRFVTVLRQGGTADRIFDRPRLAIFAWAASDTEAKDMAAVLRGHVANMPGLVGGVRVTRVQEFAGLAPAPDSSGQARWTFSPEITIRGRTQ